MESNIPHIPGGCVLLARKMLDSDLMDQSPMVVKLWVWLLLKANFKDRDQLKRGQLVTTIAEMQGAMSHYAGWRKICPTPDRIRSAYGTLTHTARITTRRTTRGMVVTILNYDSFQNILAYASRTESHNENATYPAAVPHDTEEGKECKKEKKTSSPDALRLSGLLADLVLKNNPKHSKLSNGGRESTVVGWAQDIDKLVRIDGQAPREVEQVITWCQSDGFWKANILSGAKLREKWNQLSVKAASEGSKLINQPAEYTPPPKSDESKARLAAACAKMDAEAQAETDRWNALSPAEQEEIVRQAKEARAAMLTRHEGQQP